MDAVNNLRRVTCGIAFLPLLYIMANLIYSGLAVSDLIKVAQVAKQLRELSIPEDCGARISSGGVDGISTGEISGRTNLFTA